MSKQREEFIQNLFEHLKNKEYLLLKFTENSLSEIDEYSDLDIFISKSEWESVEEFAASNNTITDIKKHRQSSMSQLFLFFKDGGFLQIDGLFQLIRKNLIYLSPIEIKENQQDKAGVKTYSNFNLFQHLVLFNQLNFAGLPEKYLTYFKKMEPNSLSEILKKFKQKYNCDFNSIEQFAVANKNLRNKIIQKVKRLPENNFIARQNRWCREKYDSRGDSKNVVEKI